MSDILFSTIKSKTGYLGQVILNRPNALNALTPTMCQTLYHQLMDWRDQPNIQAIIIRGNGDRAFCAGGDIRFIYQNKHKPCINQNFFKTEYQLNALIHHFPKPYLAFLHGITMGGGAGLSMHGTFRISDETLCFAMPETKIGFFPDVGANYFLSRCPNYIGYYLGLTGLSINVADAYYLKLITHRVSRHNQEHVINALTKLDLSCDAFKKINQLLIEATEFPSFDATLQTHATTINSIFSAPDIKTIIQQLDAQQTPWAHAVIATLHAQCPLSLAVSLAALQRAQTMTFDKIIKMEYRIACQFLKTPNFFEGIRAAIIDKDKQPHWVPQKITDITPDTLDPFFN